MTSLKEVCCQQLADLYFLFLFFRITLKQLYIFSKIFIIECILMVYTSQAIKIISQ